MELLQKRAYTPYSGIQKYCLIEGGSGLIYPGVRVENRSFPLTISSVQAAISSCLANNDKPVSYYYGEREPELLSYWTNEYNLVKKEIQFSSPDAQIFDPFVTETPDFIKKLKELCNDAVTLNSNFPVAAILETDRGYVTGVNTEGSSWSLGLCAERVAVSRALAAGAGSLLSLHVMAPKSDFSSPCGACRQVIHEFMPKKQVHLYHTDDQKSVHFSEHLLPYAFTATSL